MNNKSTYAIDPATTARYQAGSVNRIIPMAKKLFTSTRKLRGNSSGKKMRPPLSGNGDLWSPPRWFNAALREKWNYTLETAPKGLLTGTDRDLLVTWCVACVGHSEAARDMLSEELVIDGSQNPKLIIMNKHAETMIRLSKMLGFSPGSRALLGTVITFGPAEQVEGSVASFIEQRPLRIAA